MAFKKGEPRHANAGRKKGTPNRKTQDLMEICEEEGVEPFRALLRMTSLEYEPEIRMAALKEVCSYLYPKRKALEVSGELSNPYADKSYEELKALVLEKLNKDGR